MPKGEIRAQGNSTRELPTRLVTGGMDKDEKVKTAGGRDYFTDEKVWRVERLASNQILA
jgi:hypothetical protein